MEIRTLELPCHRQPHRGYLVQSKARAGRIETSTGVKTVAVLDRSDIRRPDGCNKYNRTVQSTAIMLVMVALSYRRSNGPKHRGSGRAEGNGTLNHCRYNN